MNVKIPSKNRNNKNKILLGAKITNGLSAIFGVVGIILIILKATAIISIPTYLIILSFAIALIIGIVWGIIAGILVKKNKITVEQLENKKEPYKYVSPNNVNAKKKRNKNNSHKKKK